MCLFHALAGEEDETGAIAERDGQAAAPRMRAGEPMASGCAKRLSRESDSQWNAHVAAMAKPRLLWLPRGACQAAAPGIEDAAPGKVQWVWPIGSPQRANRDLRQGLRIWGKA